MNKSIARAALALSVVGGCTDAGSPLDSTQPTYAEAVYGNYEEAANGKIHFELATLEAGQLSQIAQQPITDALGAVPADWIAFHSEGLDLVDVARGPRNPAIDEWTTPPSLTDFDAMGFPVADGAYRLLDVRATIDGITTQHRAIEACWDSLDHCVVIDPVVMQVDGYYQNRQRWIAEGWTKQDGPAETTDQANLASYCRLSKYGTTSHSVHWPAKYAAGFNALGWKLYENWIGAQDYSIRCYVNSNGACKAAASSSSDGSSCATYFIGWGCDCDNLDHFGYTGSTARTAAQTKCVNNFGGASISAGISGSGASFSVTWNISSGTQYTNGGSYTDTCIWQ